MAVAFTHMSWWLWSGKHQEPRTILPNGSLNPSQDSNLRELDAVNFPTVKGRIMASPTKRVKRKWSSREERKIDKEYDVVLVPSDGGWVSGSESDDSDWSIGWLEPHGPEFQSDDETDGSFAVLVPCYGRGCEDLEERPKNNVLHTFGNITDRYSDESKKYMEQWLSSLHS